MKYTPCSICGKKKRYHGGLCSACLKAIRKKMLDNLNKPGMAEKLGVDDGTNSISVPPYNRGTDHSMAEAAFQKSKGKKGLTLRQRIVKGKTDS